MLFLYTLLISLIYAEIPTETIIVEAHRALELYVAPTKIINHTSDIEAIIGDDIVFGFSSTLNKNATYKNMGDKKDFKVYDINTINYAWDNCDYKKDAKKCAFQNDHYLLETRITIDTHELVVAMYLYDSNLQVISMGVVTDTKTINWIRQQRVIIQNQQSTSPQGTVSNNQTIIKEPEELPLKWEIPHYLMNRHLQQASKILWWSTLIKN